MMILPELLFEVRGRRWAQFIAPPHRRGLTELGLASTGAEAVVGRLQGSTGCRAPGGGVSQHVWRVSTH